MRTIYLIAIIVVLTGCAGRASVSENQCIAGDWQTLGYRDGANGLRSSQLLAHQDACGEYGVVPDRASYMLGWREGVRGYCEPDNGFNLGEWGKGHANVCPKDLRANFVAAYQEGRSLYLARSAVRQLERAIAAKQDRLDYVQQAIISSATAQLSPDLSPAERVELLAETQRLHEEKHELRVEIPALEEELSIALRELDNLSRTLAAVVH